MSIELMLRREISDKGYIDLARFMELNLTSSRFSYYRNSSPLGESGDFITAPEASQLFGEMLGMWCYLCWQQLGRPAKLNLVELGPGRGLMMQDILRSTKNLPEFHNSLNISLFEISEELVKAQTDNLEKYRDKVELHWIDKLAKIDEAPTIFLANEFFDALPVRQFVKIKDEWFENTVATDPETEKFTLRRQRVNELLEQQLSSEHPSARDGAILEESPKTLEYIRTISQILEANDGFALIIDYGYQIPPKTRTKYQYTPTLQAVKNHKYVPIFDSFGEEDLTAHVDFHAIKQKAMEYSSLASDTIKQNELLSNLGIDLRFKQLLNNSNSSQAETLKRGYHRIMDESQMGSLFKAMALSGGNQLPPCFQERR